MSTLSTSARVTPAEPDGLGSLLALVDVLETRAPGFGRRAQLTGSCAERLGLAAGLSPAAGARLRRAGTLCDTGLLALPDGVLGADSPPDADDWLQLRRHPEISSRLLGSLGEDEAASWVLAHHERPDGLGYPYGLIDHQLTIEAKVLAVAGGYAALRVPPAYLPAHGHQRASRELRAQATTAFDGGVLGLLESCVAPRTLAVIGTERLVA